MYDESRAGRDGGQKLSWIYTHFIINQTGKTRKKRRAESALFFSIQTTIALFLGVMTSVVCGSSLIIFPSAEFAGL